MATSLLHLVIIISIVICPFYQVESFKHVIFMHGIFAGPSEFQDLHSFIEEVHPGTTVSVIDAFNGKSSIFNNLWTQAETIAPQMQKIMNDHEEGVHLLCFSQGGLLCRGILETLDDHNVQHFISLSSPQGGQYGDTSYLKYFFPTYVKSSIYELFYSWIGQREISIANYWNDPHHHDLYLKYSNFLAVINNQTYNKKSEEYKKNFSRIKNLVLVGGPDDGVITPWQSSQFAAYDANDTVVGMEGQEWYIKDSFGLQTLNNRKAIHSCIVPGVEHIHWHQNRTVFDKCIKPWLT